MRTRAKVQIGSGDHDKIYRSTLISQYVLKSHLTSNIG